MEIKPLQMLPFFSFFSCYFYRDSINNKHSRIMWFTFRLIMAHMVAIILLVALGYTQISESNPSNILDDICTALCMANLKLGSKWNQCSYDKMYEMYKKRKDANCINCAKYFHCQSNYNVIYTTCPDASGSGRDTAINVRCILVTLIR